MARPPPPGEYYEDYEEDWGNGSLLLLGAPGCAWPAEEDEAAAAADWEVSFSLLPVLYMLVFVLGLSGNGLVLLTLCRRGGGGGGGAGVRRRSADAYLAHLALADLAFVVTLPLWAAYTALRFHWPFGSALCKLSSYLVLLNMFASAFCLGGLSVERYLAVVRALPRLAGRPGGGVGGVGGVSSSPSPGRPRPATLLALGAVWLLAALLALPALLLRDTRPAGGPGRLGVPDGNASEAASSSSADRAAAIQCDMDFSRVASSPAEEGYWLAALSLATTALGFVLPLLLMTLCYCGIGATVRRHFQPPPQPPPAPPAPSGRRKEDGQQRRRLLRILVALVGVFAGCWLPFHLLKSLFVLDWVGLVPLPCALQQLVVRLHPYATCLAYINSCLNPFLYAFFDGRFRAQCRLLLGLRRRARRAPDAAGSVSSTLSGQTQKSEAPSLGTKV